MYNFVTMVMYKFVVTHGTVAIANVHMMMYKFVHMMTIQICIVKYSKTEPF